MAQEQWTPESFIDQLKQAGEEKVFARFIDKQYGDVGHPKYELAKRWLFQRDQRRLNRPAWLAAIAAIFSAVAAAVSAYFAGSLAPPVP